MRMDDLKTHKQMLQVTNIRKSVDGRLKKIMKKRKQKHIRM